MLRSRVDKSHRFRGYLLLPICRHTIDWRVRRVVSRLPRETKTNEKKKFVGESKKSRGISTIEGTYTHRYLLLTCIVTRATYSPSNSLIAMRLADTAGGSIIIPQADDVPTALDMSMELVLLSRDRGTSLGLWIQKFPTLRYF